MFHDQTQATEKRVKRFYSSSDVISDSSSSKSPCSTSSQDFELSKFLLPSTTCIAPSPSQSHEQLALGFFFNKFVLVPRHSVAGRGFLEVLPFLYLNADSTSPLSSATMAISLAVYANDPVRKTLLSESRYKYGEALFRVSGALQDPVAVRKDETLMTILLLGILEVRLTFILSMWEASRFLHFY